MFRKKWVVATLIAWAIAPKPAYAQASGNANGEPATAACQVAVAGVAVRDPSLGDADRALLSKRLVESLTTFKVKAVLLSANSPAKGRLEASPETFLEARAKSCPYLLISSLEAHAVPPWGRADGDSGSSVMDASTRASQESRWWRIHFQLICVDCKDKAYDRTDHVDEGTDPLRSALSAIEEAAASISGELQRRAKKKKRAPTR